jgi:NAD(P)-dependent dehydrogenase (short-subunit alcohol dehydrogenase family)
MFESSGKPLARRRALITGATNGIGRATAVKLAADGAAEVLVHGHDPRRGAETVEAIRAAGSSGRFISADFTDPSEVRRLAEQAGEIDILVNNAGISVWGPTADFNVTDNDDLFDANVRSAFVLVAALAPGMAQRRSGSIINISSMAGRLGLAGGASYSATKASLEAMTRPGRRSTALRAYASTRWRQGRCSREHRRHASSWSSSVPPPRSDVWRSPRR